MTSTDEEQISVPPPDRGPFPWGEAWQVPALLGAIGLLVSGLVFAVATSRDPQLDRHLDRSEVLIGLERYADAIDLLNSKVYPFVEKGEIGAEDRQRYHLLIARSIYEGQRSLGLDREDNNQSILQQYLEAERHDAMLVSSDQHALAQTLLSLRDTGRAQARARLISDESRHLRDAFNRRLIDEWLARSSPARDEALSLLTEMLADPGLPVDQRVWAMARQTEIRLETGFVDEAIIRLLRAMPRLDGATPEGLASLHLLLARAYFESQAVDEASRQLELARAFIVDGHRLHALLLLYDGRILELQGQVLDARDRYAEILERHSDSPAETGALLGLARIEASLNRVVSSLEAFQRLVDRQTDGTLGSDPSRDEVVKELLHAYRARLVQGEPEAAIKFATRARDMFGAGERPATVLEALATAHRAFAELLIGPVEEGVPRSQALTALDPSTRREAQQHLLAAAANFRMHADKFRLTDEERYASSIWAAADLFDQAGDLEEAIAGFDDYVSGLQSDPRHAEARFRLGQAHQARGDLDQAAELFEGLIEQKRSGLGADVGPFADAAYVPLAQVYLLDNDDTNDDRAEELLVAVVDGTIGGTDSVQFRGALFELGDLHYRAERFGPAIERFEEAIKRYPTVRNIESIRFKLADSYRLSAREIDQTLQGGLPETRHRRLEAMRDERRRLALSLFERVRRTLEEKEAARRSPLEDLQLRNSYFYLGDCAFDLGDYATAIRHYDAARERYPEDPASLVAMVQIVSAHVEQGDLGRARTANERARRFYQGLPESVWEDPTLPMDKADWERWLNSSARLYAVQEG